MAEIVKYIIPLYMDFDGKFLRNAVLGIVAMTALMIFVMTKFS
jgi:hypothetical protein